MSARPERESSDTPAGDGRRPFRVKLNVIGAFVLLAVLTAWVVAYRTTQQMGESADLVAHTQSVIAAIRGAESELEEAEAAQRDYLLTGENLQRDQFAASIASHRAQVAGLRTLTRDNPEQTERLTELERLSRERIMILDSLTTAVGTLGREAAQTQAAQPGSQRFRQEIDSQFDLLEQEELLLLAARSEESRGHARSAGLILAGTGAFTLLVLLSAAYLLNRDISRQEEADHRLRHALHAAAAANQAKTQFLATVSHEIRTPLNAVSGMSELLLDTRLDSEQAEYARTLHSNAEALTVLIGDLLDSSKIEAGQIDLESLPFDLREVVEGVAEILIVRAEIKGIQLIIDVAPDLPAQFVGDRNRLRQIVMNLVGNAVKFTEQGEVTVRVRAGNVDNDSAAIRIDVIDTGIGIAPEARSRIFERFVQGDRSTIRRYGGTGLGLNISRSLIELMGGTLSLDSVPERGSTFTAALTLPVAGPQPAPLVAPDAIAGADVLVVEANANLREVLERLLRAGGADVRAAATASAAAEAHRARPARVVVASESLPDSSGLEVARMLALARGDSPAGAAPAETTTVLVCSLRSLMTGYVGSFGISGFVYKPVKQARLLEAVRFAAGLEPKPAARAVNETAERPARGPSAPRVLLAEDHRDNWILATRILVGAGYDVDLAEDGVKAVDMAAAFRYDLILMDIEMPLLDGIEATRRVRARDLEEGRPAVPIVAVTAHAVEDVRADALASGMDDYTTKPIQKQKLLEVCARWIDARPVLLLADDSPENHVLVTNYLGADYRLISVYNGRDAVDAFTRQRVSLVLLDIDMPLLNGYEAAREIRRARAGDAVPIVALTGYEGTEERQRALRAGCTAYLTKPIHRAELLATVRQLTAPATAPLRQMAALSGADDQAAVDASSASVTQPEPREVANQIRGLLARRDFAALVALAQSLRDRALAAELTKVATVAGELVGAARAEDEQRSAWWGEQLVPALREGQRILAVRASASTGAHGSYDSLTRLAAQLLGVPMAAVTLLDEDLVRIKGASSDLGPYNDTRELPLSHSLSQLVAATGGQLFIEDARNDPRVRNTPAVRMHGMASYGGVPLTGEDGLALGVFCAVDRQPRRWSPHDMEVLEELAYVANRMLQMERRLAALAAPATTPHEGTPAQPAAEIGAPAAGTPAAGERLWLTVDDDVADLAPGYVAARRQNVPAMREMLDRGDLDSISRLAHNMKGSGEGYGLPEVSRIGRDLEQAARAGDRDTVRRHVAELDGFLSRVNIRAADGRVLMES